MPRIILFIVFILCSFTLTAQSPTPKVGWFFTPEVSGMLLDQHIGRTLGFQTGITLLNRNLQIGLYYYGRSGPINPHTINYALPEGTTYRGQSSIHFRADHGAFGLFVSPQFRVGKVTLDVPIMFGGMGAGFYLTDEDRITPDGRRVSEWEDELLGDADAGGGTMLEIGVRARTAITPGIEIGIGGHYTQTFNYFSTLGGNDYYNAPRFSLFLMFGN